MARSRVAYPVQQYHFHHRGMSQQQRRLRSRRLRHQMYHNGAQHLYRNSAQIIDINFLKSETSSHPLHTAALPAPVFDYDPVMRQRHCFEET